MKSYVNKIFTLKMAGHSASKKFVVACGGDSMIEGDLVKQNTCVRLRIGSKLRSEGYHGGRQGGYDVDTITQPIPTPAHPSP